MAQMGRPLLSPRLPEESGEEEDMSETFYSATEENSPAKPVVTSKSATDMSNSEDLFDSSAEERSPPVPSSEVHKRMMDDPAYRQAWADSDLPMQIAFELCDARKRAGISRAELARRIGADEAEIAKWEKGDGTLPDLRALRRYADATGSRLRITLATEP